MSDERLQAVIQASNLSWEDGSVARFIAMYDAIRAFDAKDDPGIQIGPHGLQQVSDVDPPWLGEAACIAHDTFMEPSPTISWAKVVRAVLAFADRQPRLFTDAMVEASARRILLYELADDPDLQPKGDDPWLEIDEGIKNELLAMSRAALEAAEKARL